MSWEIMFVLSSILIMVCAMIFEVMRTEIIMALTLVLFLSVGIISPEEAVKGFSNQAMITVGLLFIIAGTIKKTGIIDRIIYTVLKKPSSDKAALLKILLPSSLFSAFLNNTPIVTAFAPAVKNWSEEHHQYPSIFLLPLSYATILGGMITLMGSSTNVIVHGMMIQEFQEGFSFFELAIIGIPALVIGLAYLVVFSSRLLPKHQSLKQQIRKRSREYLGEVLVTGDYPYLDRTVKEAGLRELQGLYLIMIVRNGENLSPVKSTTVIEEGDRLIFTGLISTIVELQGQKGLEIITDDDQQFNRHVWDDARLVEAVVSHQSSLLFKKIKENGFRGKYDAAVIAVHRKNERLKQKIGDIVLKPGDTLLLLIGSDFDFRNHEEDFYIVTPIFKTNPFSSTKTIMQGWIDVGLFFLTILLISVKIVPLLSGVAMLTILYFVLGKVSPDEAKQYVRFNVLFIIACSIGIGEALVQSGAAFWLAEKIVLLLQPFGIVAAMLGIYMLTNLFTEVMTNHVSAIIMFPIAMEVANTLQIDPSGMAVIIACAASSSFSTPIGYQTNLIVYGPGGYQFLDYIKFGSPLNGMVMVLTIWIVYFRWMM